MFGLSTQQMVLYGLAAALALPILLKQVGPLLTKAKSLVPPLHIDGGTIGQPKRTVGDVRLEELAFTEKNDIEASEFSSVCDMARKYLGE